jgi:hypothetical protein
MGGCGLNWSHSGQRPVMDACEHDEGTWVSIYIKW